MASYLELNGEEEEEFQVKVDKKSDDLFGPRPNNPQLTVSRIFSIGSAQANEAMSSEQDVDIVDAAQLKALRSSTIDLLQVFFIRQKRSWAPLDISRELFEEFVRTFAVFSPFWRCIFTFGNKCEEHECEFPGFRWRGPSMMPGKDALEAAYVIRHAELNHRKLAEGQIPWSIRQSAVYYQYDMEPRHTPDTNDIPRVPFKHYSTILLISPSQFVDRNIGKLLRMALADERAVSPCVLHSLIVSDSVKGWMEYIAWLEQDIKERSDRIIFSTPGSTKGKKTEGFSFNVEDRQALKVTEDSVIDLQIILLTLMNTIKGIRKFCLKCCELCCELNGGESCSCGLPLDEFDAYLTEVELCVERAKSLKDRVTSTAKLLSDLLRYEDQKALQDLTEQSQVENRMMHSLAEKSTKDAEAVKVLTIIGLVYLPTTFVANFFSTEFVQTDDSGNMSVSANTWLLAAIALPLTILTVSTWWVCVRYKNTKSPHKPLKCYIERCWAGLVSSVRGKKRPQVSDIENPQAPPVGAGPVSVGTWSTGKITLQEALP